jgi:serine phosphatase RsbU (regulator of sigma subunit)
MAVAAGVLGIGTPAGAGLAAGAGVWLLVDLFVIQPKLAAGAGKGGADVAALEFLQRALAFTHIEEVASEFGKAVTAGVGDTTSILLAASHEGGVRVLRASGTGAIDDVGDANEAFLWLGDRVEPLGRAELDQLSEFEGARATADLMDRLGCDVLLPLRHRGLLLGLGLIHEPRAADSGALAGFYRAMCAYTTVAVANTFLDAETRDKSALAHSFDLATAMQESLMPDERPIRRPTFELKGVFRPVSECGGDLWAWRELRDSKVLLVVADATGHGAAPALLSAVAKGAIDAHWQMGLSAMDPAQLLAALNRSIHRTGKQRYMMTAFAAVVDTVSGEVVFANAGQNFPYLISERGIEALVARGNSLGATAEAHFESHTRQMSPGDRLLLYTDGITEAGSPFMEPWGEKRFRAAITAMSGERATRIPELLLEEVEEYIKTVEISDDITMLSFELLERGH